MAFDVVLPINNNIADNFNPNAIGSYVGNMETVNKTREVTLFEGKDEFGRLQPLLGTRVNGVWKAIPWHSATTEMPELDDTEVWEIYNFTGDAHPVHLHLVNFEILGRNDISFDSDDGEPGQEVLQHNGALGVAPVITNVSVGGAVYLDEGDGYFEKAPKDMVTALPEQVTRVKATFDKPGRYVWHCHILSHEDHEMMRVLQVVPSAAKPIAADENAGTPNAYALDQNYPNPFNPSTQIRFQLPKAQRVTLEIFNIRGQKVRTLIDSRYSAGSHEVVWNGLNNRGRQVASGIYVYKIRAGNFTQTRKMNLIR
jgi:hypothetical protein